MLVSRRHQAAGLSTGGTAPDAAARVVVRVIAAVRGGRAGRLFPPVAAEGPEQLLAVKRWLGGIEDARALRRTLARPRFAPLRELLAALDLACARWRRRADKICNPGLLQIINARVFGPLVTEAYIACALARPAAASAIVATLGDGFTAAFDRFVQRLTRDVATGMLARAPIAAGRKRRREPARVTSLNAHMAETHNGRQFAIEVRLSDGARWMYKPRPADGEECLLQRGADHAKAGGRRQPRRRAASLFEQINQLRPAAGAPELPTLCVLRGSGRGGAWYGWHEWVEAPRRVAVRAQICEEQRHELRAARLSPRRAARLWYRAGALSAACLAFGATDLFADNIVVGTRLGAPEPRPYPVDLELIGYPLRRLAETGLLGTVEDDRGVPHPGLARTASWRADGGPLAFFRAPTAGGLTLQRGQRPWVREEARELVTDTAGQAGYAAHLTALLRGLFDLWITLVQRKAELRSFLRGLPAPRVRVLVRPTLSYASRLDAALTGRSGAQREGVPGRPPRGQPEWSDEERAQLRRFDVPYFLQRPGEPLSELTPPPAPARMSPVRGQPFTHEHRGPVPLQQRLDELGLPALGIAMRDVIASVAAQLPRSSSSEGIEVRDRRRGVEIEGGADRGAVTLTWREARQRLCFRWGDGALRVEPSPLPSGASGARRSGVRTNVVLPALRKQLLRLDRIDAVLHDRFQKSGFRDRTTELSLERLIAGGVAVLEPILAEHGWPGRSLVGARAAAAACRLVQHADRFADLQRRCVPLLAEAVARGEATPRQLAYLTDQVRIRAEQPQLYGTKFRRHGGELVPYPIEDAEGVDRRRREMGMESLAAYTRKVRRTFAPAPAPATARATRAPRAGVAGEPLTEEAA